MEESNVEILRVDTNDNPADILTKALGITKFMQDRAQLGLEFTRPESASDIGWMHLVRGSVGL